MKNGLIFLMLLSAGVAWTQDGVKTPGAFPGPTPAAVVTQTTPAGQAAGSTQATPADPVQDSRAQDIINRFGAVNTIYSSFVQEKHMALLTEPVMSEGVFAFEKNPARIRWEYKKPFQNGFIIDGSKTFRLEKGVKTPVKSVMARNIAAQMLVWLAFDLKTLSKTYDVSYFDGGVTLTPKAKENQLLEKITVYFSPENPQALSKVEMAEAGGDSTVLLFSGTEVNKPLSKDVFE